MNDYGITVTGIKSGDFLTEMTKVRNAVKEMDRDWQRLPEDLKIEYGNKCLEAGWFFSNNNAVIMECHCNENHKFTFFMILQR